MWMLPLNDKSMAEYMLISLALPVCSTLWSRDKYLEDLWPDCYVSLSFCLVPTGQIQMFVGSCSSWWILMLMLTRTFLCTPLSWGLCCKCQELAGGCSPPSCHFPQMSAFPLMSLPFPGQQFPFDFSHVVNTNVISSNHNLLIDGVHCPLVTARLLLHKDTDFLLGEASIHSGLSLPSQLSRAPWWRLNGL